MSMEYPISNYGNEDVIAWCPTATSLQIKGKTTLLKTSPTAILDVATQVSYDVTFKPSAIYLELYPIIFHYVSFEDVTYPAIQRFWGGVDLTRFPTTESLAWGLLTDAHPLTENISWFDSQLTGYYGLLTPRGSLSIYPVPLENLHEYLAYGFAKLGYAYNGRSITDATQNQ